jgi:CheY-like chemotaxis protein
MKVLLVEDDENKVRRLNDFLRERYPAVYITNRRSLQSGLRYLLEEVSDLVLLDMNLPNYDITSEEPGGRLQAFAGREFLRQMSRRKIVIPVIVVTQLDYFGEGKGLITLAELKRELKGRFESVYRGTVYYHTSSDDWKKELLHLIRPIFLQKEEKN